MFRILVYVSVLLVMSGCASVAEVNYFTLSPIQAAPVPVRSNGRSYYLKALHLTGVADRPHITIRTSEYAIATRENDRWAEPLDQMIFSVIAEGLGRSATQVEMNTQRPLARDPLSVEITEFLADTNGSIRLVGYWVETGSTSAPHFFNIEQNAVSTSGQDIAKGMSFALAQLVKQMLLQ